MKKLMAILICLSMGLLFVGIANAEEKELLINGGFETEEGWGIIRNDANPHTGNYAGRFNWDGGVSQIVGVIPEETYNASGWAYIPAGGDPISWGSYIAVDWLNADGEKITGETWSVDPKDFIRDEWRFYESGNLIAPALAVKARIGIGTWTNPGINPAAPTDFDDLSFVGEPIPEPATILLLSAGLIGLFSFGRKRKK